MGAVTQMKRAAKPAEWLSPEQVCERVPGMTLKRLEDRRAKLQPPDFMKPTLMTVVYSSADVDAWVESTRVRTRR